MTVALPLRDGVVTLPQEIAVRYVNDWRRSGLWSLPGTKDIPTNTEQQP
jgi:hypothetical protein